MPLSGNRVVGPCLDRARFCWSEKAVGATLTIMSQPASTSAARREFLKFLAASPYVAALGGVTAFLQQGPLAKETQQGSEVITSPSEALDVLDFEEAAH